MELRRFIAIIWQRAWLIAFATILVAVTTFILSATSTRIYEASTTLEINYGADPRSDAYASLLVSERAAKTYVEQLRAPRLRSAVVAALGPNFRASAIQEVGVAQVRDTQLIRIMVASSDPASAQLMANKLAETFIAQIVARQEERFQNTKRDLDSQIADLEKQIADTQKAISSLGDPRDAKATSIPEFARLEQVRLQTNLSNYQTRYITLLRSAEDLRLSSARYADNISVVAKADLPRYPVRPAIMLSVLLGLIGGLVLGLSAAFLLEYLDDSVKGPDELESTLQLPALGVISRLRDLKSPRDALIASDGRSAVSEAYRILRTNLQFAEFASPRTSIVVTSAEPSEGKSTTLANLGIVLAQAGKRVIMVDSDLRRPVLHRLFDVPREPGLTDLLVGTVSKPDKALAPTMVPGLRLLPSGPLPPNPAEILASSRMAEILSLLEEQADIVLFDSPPVLSVADATPLAACVGNVVLVVAAGQTRSSAVARAKEALQRSGTRVLGIVLNKLEVERRGYYYYYSYRYYQYYGTDGSDEGGFGATSRRNGHPSSLLERVKPPWFGRKAHRSRREKRPAHR